MTKIEIYNFFFHPLHATHAPWKKALAVITHLALTLLSCGTYLIVFGIARLNEHRWISSTSSSTRPSLDIPPDNPGKRVREILSLPRGNHYVGNYFFKLKIADHLSRLKKLAEQGNWEHLRQHTSHRDSGFDWWMFPSDRDSRGQGSRYKLSQANVKELRKDRNFMENYREGVCLVALSWGWDLKNNCHVKNPHPAQKWSGYGIRLGKMLYSLRLFGEDDLRRALSQFVCKVGPQSSLIPINSLEEWARDALL